MEFLYSNFRVESNKYYNAKFDLSKINEDKNESIKSKIDRINSKKESVRIDLFGKLEIALEYIHKNLFEKLTVKKVAFHCGMSEYHFSRTFKDAYGISPYSYIIQKRLESALEMLQKGDKSLNQIASDCCFNDLSHFTRYFKKQFKTLPSKIKKQIRMQ